MEWTEALILGLIQGLTEFLPISSSGHLEIFNVLLGLDKEGHLSFTVMVHGATVLSIIAVFWHDIGRLLRGMWPLRWNEETRYGLNILISMIPVGIVGFFFEEQIDRIFSGNLAFVGYMLLITAGLLAVTYYARSKGKPISSKNALVMGVAQAFAVLPGISRSGATISSGLLMGNKREEVTKFSFLMVLLPVLGANFKLLLDTGSSVETMNVLTLPVWIGFFAAFFSGVLACKWMVHLVKHGKILYFSLYCLIMGGLAIILA